MKKIGILTINDYKNYGNRLQNYATQEIIKHMGFNPETIVNTTMTPPKNIKNNSYIKKLDKYILSQGKYSSRHKNIANIEELNREKIENFKVFTKKYIKETDFKISVNNIPDNLDYKYDYFITGSDQVWNPSFRHFSEIDFLTFASKEKRIAFAASFGISSIPKELEKEFANWIKNMNYISVRETQGAKLVRDLADKDSIVLLDPTMMLDDKRWLDISKEHPNKPKTKYMCTYFLGETYNVHKTEIHNIAKKYNFKIVNLGNLNNIELYSADPSEFLDFIAWSELVLTDSFHGAVFSIIFKKPFIVFDRISNLIPMESRIDTLLCKFNLQDRKWEYGVKKENYLQIDFSHIKPILCEERINTFNYLEDALNI